VDGLARIRFTSPHPSDMSARVIAAIAGCAKVCPQVHLPLQSASDPILRAMQRSYTLDEYREVVARLRAAIPGLALTTDIIVGFPGETEEDFADTLDVVERAGFDSAYTFQYSPRPGTRAAAMPDQVPKEVVQERFDRLVALQSAITAERNRRQVGGVVEVLVEGDGKRHGSTQSRTRTNRIVHLREALPAGAFATAEITDAAAHHLLGRVVAAPQPAAV
jgi:tRNA-2-methylthio-N6-dimethylallyladenosine synthase